MSLERERDSYRDACLRAGICMTCVVQAPEAFGCSDCQNTGWERGDPYVRAEAAEAERDRQYEENVNRIAAEGVALLRAEAAEREVERLLRLANPEPVVKILDEESAWIARPNDA